MILVEEARVILSLHSSPNKNVQQATHTPTHPHTHTPLQRATSICARKHALKLVWIERLTLAGAIEACFAWPDVLQRLLAY